MNFTYVAKGLSLLVLSCCRSEGGGWLLSVTWCELCTGHLAFQVPKI